MSPLNIAFSCGSSSKRRAWKRSAAISAMGATFVNVDWTISICFGVMVDSPVTDTERAAMAKRLQPALRSA